MSGSACLPRASRAKFRAKPKTRYLMSTCAHCGHTRQPDETQSPFHCPACGIEYGQRVDLHAYQIDDRPKPVGIIPREVLIGGGVLIVLCLLAFLAFTQRDRPWDEAEAVKAVAAAPITAARPAAPAVVAPVQEPTEAEERLAHELWLSMAFAERAGKEFQRFADSPLSQLGERWDALFALKRDWDEMILSNPCIAAAKPILSSALSQASDAVTAKRVGNPDRDAITIAATEEYARFVQTVQACKQPRAAAPASHPETTAPAAPASSSTEMP